MYSSHGFRDYEIGDVDVVRHNGVYHLFHLVLPNHDYIAHAVSPDGLHWQRVKNALFIGDPEAWDDDMLWTMHVTPNPYRPGAWRMFYTGLCMRESGRVQRVGLAHSDDLYHWHKDTSGAFPLAIPAATDYEHDVKEGRKWVSFRDPFCYQDNGETYLLAAARVKSGPIIRRGCVSLAKEIAEGKFEFRPPLFYPIRYDDIEVPNLMRIDQRYYLVGSIREDIKVHYWYAEELTGPYLNFHDNVLLPQGNYAARVHRDEGKILVWNFFFKGLTTSGKHLMAPPKELKVGDDGKLRLRSFAGFDKLVTQTLTTEQLTPLQPLFNNPHARCSDQRGDCWFSCESGMELFVAPEEYNDFMLTGVLHIEGRGKCGLFFRINDKGDGYFISLELFKGIVQIRAWRHNRDFEEAFHYEQLQTANYIPRQGPHPFRLLAYEQYIELSLHDHIRLTLADDQFAQGRVGFYVESAKARIDNLELRICNHTPTATYPDSITQPLTLASPHKQQN